MSKYSPAADQNQRDLFIQELKTNFSVQASAGAGKTTAIIERIVSFALDPQFNRNMKQLVVVTYTVKAAAELRHRARLNILARVAGKQATLEDVNRINQAFFGTIHSFCVMLMQRFGFLTGLSTAESQLGSLDSFQPSFLAALPSCHGLLPEETRKLLYRITDFDAVVSLAEKCARANVDWSVYLKKYPLEETVPVFQELRADCLDGITSHNSKSRETIEKRRTGWREFCRRWNDRGIPFVQVPKFEKGGGAEFEIAYKKAVETPGHIKETATLVLAMEMAAQFEHWRWENGKLTFQDQINGALRLFADRVSAQAVRAEGYHIILDEAQDTDPRQFELLIQTARPVDAPLESLLEKPEGFPGGGRFCMVGDMQQLIYSQRSSLESYRRYHDLLGSSSAGGQKLNFSVTFRCSQAVVGFVNKVFPPILGGDPGQALFTPLQAREKASAGQVYCYPLPLENGVPEKWSVAEMNLYEARLIARWLKGQGLSALRARSWSEVAILLPRNAWFAAFAQAFDEIQMPCQMASGREKWMMQPAVRWSAALLKWIACPDDEFELAGILREVFALSDDAIYRDIMGDGRNRLLDRVRTGDQSVDECVRFLLKLREEVKDESLGTLFEKLSERVRLPERLMLLPSGGAQKDYWKKIRLDACEAAAEGKGIEEFITQILNPSDERVAEEEKNQNAIQLYSMHMSKGLEWDAVIMPLLARGVSQRNDIYPEVSVSAHGPVRLVGRTPREGDNSVLNPEMRFKKELARLAYVAMTRARQTLVMVDDSSLAVRLSKNSGDSLMKILAGGQKQ